MTKTLAPILVERRNGLTQREFVDEYRHPGKPVILTDLSRNWLASKQFSLEFFAESFGDQEIEIGDNLYNLGELIKLLKNSTKESPAPYPIKLNLRSNFSGLKPYVEPRPKIAQPDRTSNPLLPKRLIAGLHDLEVFLGGPGGEFPYLHYDYLGFYAFINQLYGEKEFTLFSPEQQPYLYPNPDSPWLSEITDHHNPDLKKYPLFANATPTTIVVSAGETLFIPYGWYHTARSLSLTISVAFDQLCQSNWNFFVNECLMNQRHSSLKASLIRGYLAVLGASLTAYERFMGTP